MSTEKDQKTEARSDNANSILDPSQLTSMSDALFDPSKIDILNDVIVNITIEIGRAKIKIRDLLSLTKGSVIELDKLAGEPVDVYANGKLISIGNIIKSNDKYCVKLVSIPNSSKEDVTE